MFSRGSQAVVVAAAQIGRGQLHGAADAFGDVVAGEFDVQAAGMAAEPGVHVEEAVHLVHDPVQVPDLHPAGRLLGVAVHRIALPNHQPAGGPDLLHQRRQHVPHPGIAHPADQGEPAGNAVRIQPLDQLGGELRGGTRAELHPDRIGQPGHEVQVRPVELPGPFADPEEVAGQVVGPAAFDPGQRAFVFQEQRLVAGKQLDHVQRGVIDAAGAHELHRPVDLGREVLVPGAGLGGGGELGVPGVHPLQRGQPATGVGTHQVEGAGRRRVGAQQPLRIGRRPSAEAVNSLTMSPR